MKENLLVEVNRMREIMGLNLLSEQVAPAARKALNLLGYSDEAIEVMVKNGVDLDSFLKLGDNLTNMGIRSMEDWQNSLVAKGIDIASASDATILKLINDTPGLKQALESMYQKAVVNLSDELIGKSTVIPQTIKTSIETLSRKILTKDTAKTISDLYERQLAIFDNLIDSLQSRGDPVPVEVQKMRDFMLKKQVEADDFVRNSTKNSADPDALIPTSKPPIPKDGPSDADIDDIIRKFQGNPGKYPAFDQFLVSVRSIGFSKKIENLIIANYEKYYDYTPDQLIKAGMEITKNINEKNWGWAKKLFVDVTSGKLKIKNIAGLVGLVVVLSVIIPWGFTGFETSEKVREMFSGWAGLDDSEGPTIEDAKNWIESVDSNGLKLNGPGGDLEGLSVTGFAADSSGKKNEYVATLSDGRAQKLLWDPNTKKFTPQ